MANHSPKRERPVRVTRQNEPQTVPEPPVRRWPHPVCGQEPETSADPALHYIYCALSYQNQMLADIKSLLERIAAGERR